MRTKRPMPEIPFAIVEAQFTLVPLFNLPAVHYQKPSTPGGHAYSVRVLVGMAYKADGSVTEKFDYFEMDEDGTVTKAPHGYASTYKPARICGLDDAVRRYADGRSNHP